MELVQFENIKGCRVAATNSHVMAEFYKINIFSLETVIGKLISNNEITDSRYAVIYYNNLESKPSRVLYILDEIATYKVIRKYSKWLKSWMTPYEEAFADFNTLECKPVEYKKPVITKDVATKGNDMELVKIVFNDDLNVNSVDARELHKVLAVGTEFSHWVKKRIVDTMAEENVDFSIVKKDVMNNIGKLISSIDYIITLNIAKEIAMLERNEIGKKVRKYFIQCESELKARPKVVERQKGDELSIADKMLKAVACAQREALEGKTEHTGYCVQISKRVNELALGHHETGMRQKLTPEQAAAVNKVALDVVKEAMKGNLNPSNVAKTLSAKYLEEAKDKVAKKELKSSLKEFKGKVKQDGKWVEATLMIGKKG